MTQLATASRPVITEPAVAATPSAPRGDRRLPSLTGLRWAAAFVVFGLHISVSGLFSNDSRAEHVAMVLFGNGASGVSFFFILSGFVMMWAFRPDDRPLRFWRRRVARIYPVHVITALAAILLALALKSEDVPKPGPALTNLLLIHAWWPDYAHNQSMDKVSWSLGCEAFFYLVFPFVGPLAHRLSARAATIMAGGSAVIAMAIPIAAHAENVHWPVHILPIARVFEFTLGIALARLVVLGRWRGPGMEVSLAVTLIGYFTAPALPYDYSYIVPTLIGFALLIPAAATADLRGAASVWRNPAMIRLGELSFSFYMVHLLVMHAVRALFPKLKHIESIPGTLTAAGIFTLALGVTWLTYRYVEVPANRLIMGRSTLFRRRVAVTS